MISDWMGRERGADSLLDIFLSAATKVYCPGPALTKGAAAAISETMMLKASTRPAADQVTM